MFVKVTYIFFIDHGSEFNYFSFSFFRQIT